MYTNKELLFKAVVILSCLIDYAFGIVLLWLISRKKKQIDLSVLFRANGAVAFQFGLKYAVLATFGVALFGLVHLVYVDLTLTIPLVGLTLIVWNAIHRQRRPEERPLLSYGVWVASCVSLLGFGVYVYASHVEPFRLEVCRAEFALPPERAGKESFTIAVITDMQFRFVTDYERKALAQVMALKPDLILMPGDLFQGDSEALAREEPAIREMLATLDAPGGVFLVPGDVDQAPGRLESLVEGTKIKLLQDDVARTTVRDRSITIAGVELQYSSPRAQRTVDGVETVAGGDDIRIVLGHRPDVVSRLHENSRIDLVVAGHTHGGQVVVPGFGPLMTLSDVPRKVAAGGLHHLDGNAIYVSRGVGCERNQAPRIRFFCRPEISLITVKSP